MQRTSSSGGLMADAAFLVDGLDILGIRPLGRLIMTPRALIRAGDLVGPDMVDTVASVSGNDIDLVAMA